MRLRELETDFGSRTRTTLLINNRQSGRRRGRGGGNGQRQGGPQGNGSRIDSRARGNANQLYEKYKNMAADAQRAGDRVNTEYYLQFADHYFRVLSEQRGRFEEQPRRGRDDFDFDGSDFNGEEFGDEGEPVRAGEQGEAPRMAGDDRDGGRREFRGDGRDRGRDAGRDGGRREWRDRNDRGERRNGEYRNGETRAVEPELVAGQRRAEPIAADESLEARAEEVLEHDRPLDPPAPRRRGRPRRDPVEAEAGFEGLPPALSAPTGEDGGEAAPRRRRARPPAEEAPTAAE